MAKRKKARWRRIRTDWRTHPKTARLSGLARDVMQQGIESNLAGVMRKSLRQIAIDHGPLTPNGREATDREILAAIRELESRGLVRYWPALEVVWVVEAADEQSQNPACWISVREEVAEQHPTVQSALVERYGDRVTTTVVVHSPPPAKPPTPPRVEKGEGRREKGEGGGPPHPALVPGSPHETEEISLAQLRERLTYARRPSGCNALLLPDAKLRELLRAGASVDDVVETVEAFADAVDRGDEKRSDWRAHYVLSFGWFERIRATYLQRGGGPARVTTLEQALDVERRTRSLPAGWQRVAAGVVGPNGKLYDAEASA